MGEDDGVTSSGSVSFDRVADRYDATRGLPPAAERATTGLLQEELRGRGPCLEVGVGTGRIALPLHQAGLPMVGADLSAPMLAQLVAKAGGRAPFPLVRADGTALPFRDGTFGGALLAHVLHLVPAWDRLLDELVRTVRRPGVLLMSLGGFPNELGEIQRRFAEELDDHSLFVGLDHDPVALDAALAPAAGPPRLLPDVRYHRLLALGRFVDEVAAATYSWTWRLDPGDLAAAATRVRPWAAERFGELDTIRRVEVVVTWRAYDLDA